MERYNPDSITQLWENEEYDNFNTDYVFPVFVKKSYSSPTLLSSPRSSANIQTYSKEELIVFKKYHSENEIRKNWGFLRGTKSDNTIPKVKFESFSCDENNLVSKSDTFLGFLHQFHPPNIFLKDE